MSLKALNPRLYIPALLAGAFIAYTTATSFKALPPYQWALSFLLLALSAALYAVLDSGRLKKGPWASAMVAALYAAAALAVFHPTLNNIFRSDYWYILNLFGEIDASGAGALKRVAFFEFFGDIRFQPLAHFVMYLRHLALGFNVTLFHLLNIALHTGTAFLIFLLVRRLIKDRAAAFFPGLLFIVLQSHFDTIVWTYHIYIILGAILMLAALMAAASYAESARGRHLIWAALLSMLSLLLYEPALAAPAAVFVIVILSGASQGPEGKRGRIKAPAIAMLSCYIAYGAFTLYGYSLTKAAHDISVGGLMSAGNIMEAVKGLFLNLWHSVFIKNIGIATGVDILDIVNTRQAKWPFYDFIATVKFFFALYVISRLRPFKGTLPAAAIMAAVALSYLLIIAVGRVNSNDIWYFISQPRYVYFPNALLAAALALLLASEFQGRSTMRHITAIALGAIFFWNTANTLSASNTVTREMAFLDAPHYALKDFTAKNPSAKIFISFTPFNEARFFLGSDVALDILHSGHITKFPSRATHFYDGLSFAENPWYKPESPPEGSASHGKVGDFTVAWAYNGFAQMPPFREVDIVGGRGVYPSVSITADGYVKIGLIKAGGKEVEFIRLRHPSRTMGINTYTEHGGWAGFLLVKSGPEVCLFFNDALSDRVTLSEAYRGWSTDGLALYGSHYTGQGAASYVNHLQMNLERAAVECAGGQE